jgi:hypothetical protein
MLAMYSSTLSSDLDTLLAGADEYVETNDLVVAFGDAAGGFDAAGTTPILSFIGISSAPCGASIGTSVTSVIGTVQMGC